MVGERQERHIWEGVVETNTHRGIAWLTTGQFNILSLADVIEEAGLDGKTVRITVEVLKNAGGATKEAVQRENL